MNERQTIAQQILSCTTGKSEWVSNGLLQSGKATVQEDVGDEQKWGRTRAVGDWSRDRAACD